MPDSRFERGGRLRAARNAAGLTQKDMASILGCSRQLVGVLENGGKLSADHLKLWCAACGCSSETILFGSPDATSASEGVAQQFALLEPVLRARLWMLYQVFVRRGVPDRTETPP
ncbi:MAG: Helix-turn-helix domain [Variovorax sp.]|nr:Helix-turn-helix domain [Variovorax sp.]